MVNSDLREINASAASAYEVKFHNSDLTNADLAGAFFPESIFRKAVAPEADFSACVLSEADFTSARLKGSDFTESNLEEATFNDSEISGCDFSNCNISSTSFKDCSATEANFHNVEGVNSYFNNAHIPYSDFSSASLRYFKFCEATAINTDFSHSDCSNSNFSNASLTSADFTKSTLRKTDFSNTDLEEVKMESVNLCAADIDGSLLGDAFLREISINEATNLGETGHETYSQHAITTYRTYLRILRENALGYRIPTYRILERKCQKEQLYHNNQYLYGILYSVLEKTSAYGEKPSWVIRTSLGVIVSFAVAFTFVQSFNSPIFQSSLPDSVARILGEILNALYLSLSSFIGVTASNPDNGFSTVSFLSVIEALLGTLLIALLIFTLGRVATR